MLIHQSRKFHANQFELFHMEILKCLSCASIVLFLKYFAHGTLAFWARKQDVNLPKLVRLITKSLNQCRERDQSALPIFTQILQSMRASSSISILRYFCRHVKI